MRINPRTDAPLSRYSSPFLPRYRGRAELAKAVQASVMLVNSRERSWRQSLRRWNWKDPAEVAKNTRVAA